MERFDIYIHGFRADQDESPHSALARVFRIEARLARDFIRSLPRVVKRRVSLDDLERYAEALGDIGAVYELRPSPIEPARIIAIEGVGDPLDEKPTGRTLTLPPPVSSHPPPAPPVEHPRKVIQPTLLGAAHVAGGLPAQAQAPMAVRPSTHDGVDAAMHDTIPAATDPFIASGSATLWNDTTPVTPMRFDVAVDAPQGAPQERGPRALLAGVPAPTLPTFETVVQSQELAAGSGASAATLASEAAPEGVAGFSLVGGCGLPGADATRPGGGFDPELPVAQQPHQSRPSGELDVGELVRPAAPAPRPVSAALDDSGPPRASRPRYLPGDPMAPPEVLAEVRASSRPPPGARITPSERPRPSIERRIAQPVESSMQAVLPNVLRAVGALGLVAFVLLSLRALSSCDPVALLAAGENTAHEGSKKGRGKYGPIADEWLDDSMHEVVSGNKEVVRARVYELKSAGAPEVYIGSTRRSGRMRLANELVIELPREQPERQAVIDLYESYLESSLDRDEPAERVSPIPEVSVVRLVL